MGEELLLYGSNKFGMPRSKGGGIIDNEGSGGMEGIDKPERDGGGGNIKELLLDPSGKDDSEGGGGNKKELA